MSKVLTSSVLLLSIMGFTVSASNMMLNPIISVYARDYANATIFEVGMIVSAFNMISMFAKPLIGFSVGVKRMFFMPVLGLLLMTVSPLGMAFLSAPALLMLFRLLQGLGNAMFWAPSMTLIALSSHRSERIKNISSFTMITSIGMSIGPTIGTISINFLGMRGTFLLASVTPLIGFLLSLKLMQRRSALISSEKTEEISKPEFSLGSLREIFANKRITAAFAAYMSAAYAYSTFIAYGTIYAKEGLMMSGEYISLLYVGYNIIILAMRFLLSIIIHHMDKKRILIFSLLDCVCMMTLLSLDNPTIFSVSFLLLATSLGVIYPTGAMLVTEEIDEGRLALTNAFYLTMWDLGGFFGPTASSLIIDFAGIPTALIASTVPALAVLALTFTLLREKPNIQDGRHLIEERKQ